jgi:hypothetical protein
MMGGHGPFRGLEAPLALDASLERPLVFRKRRVTVASARVAAIGREQGAMRVDPEECCGVRRRRSKGHRGRLMRTSTTSIENRFVSLRASPGLAVNSSRLS